MNELVERQTKQILDTNKQLMRQAKQYKIASMQRYNIIVEYDIETKQGEFLYYDQGVPSNKHFLCSEYIRKYVYEHDQEKLLKMMEIAIEHSTENDTKLRMVSFEFQSEFHWYQVIASPIWNADNEVKQVLFTFSDIDEQYKKELELQKKAQLDILTGVLNRNAGEEKINEKLKAYSYKQDSVLFMIDIDDFKIINDTYGHDMGDSVLIKVAKIIESNCQESLVGRFGGDEFFIFIDNIKSYDDVHSCAKQIIDEVRLLGKSEFCPTVSIGIAKVREHDTFISLMKRADMALYTIKGSGKGSRCFYEEKEAVYEHGFEIGRAHV